MAAMTLSGIKDEVAALLHDASHAVWSADEIEDAVRMAFYEVAGQVYRWESTTLDDVADQREYALTAITGLGQVTGVWWPYDADDPGYPPLMAPFYMLDDDTLYLNTADTPDGTEALRVFYKAAHTLSGLDGSTATTLDPAQEQLVILGAAAYACLGMAAEALFTITHTDRAAERWQALGAMWLARYEARLAAMRGGLGPRDQGGWTAMGWPED
jgi:hypothetical protein